MRKPDLSEQIEVSHQRLSKMVQLGFSNKDDTTQNESHLTNNNFISNKDPIAIYSSEILIILIVIMILRIMEIIIYSFTSYRRNLKKKIIKTVNQNQPEA
ncbi:hypothetical protein ACKWTF_015017 [Chironomus riparius]